MKEYRFIVGGKEKKGTAIDVINPYTQKAFAKVHTASKKDIDTAIGIATKAFEVTKNLTSYQRSSVLQKISDTILKRKEELAKVLARESGKPYIYALGEVKRAASTFRIASEEANRLGGEVMPLDITEAAGDRIGFIKRFPIGPISCISPFNFPLNLLCHKVAPAIAVGSTFVAKPASATPLSALLLGKIVIEAGYPKEAVNVLPCSRQDADAFVEDERFKLVTFTGSPQVGWDMKKRAGKKKVVLELGGNAGAIVDKDADLDHAAKRIALGAFAYSGQVCISVQRTLVHKDIYSSFVKKLIKEVKALKVGDPLKESITFGPMIDKRNAERIEEWVNEAVKGGAKILTGGKRKGTLYAPTVLENVPKRCRLAKEEAFGPILNLEKFSSFDKALADINDSAFGLQAGIFTQDIDKAMRSFSRLEVGGVIVNDIPTFRVDNMPYGGVKDSGFGREGLKYAIDDMTELKVMVVNNQR